MDWRGKLVNTAWGLSYNFTLMEVANRCVQLTPLSLSFYLCTYDPLCYFVTSVCKRICWAKDHVCAQMTGWTWALLIVSQVGTWRMAEIHQSIDKSTCGCNDILKLVQISLSTRALRWWLRISNIPLVLGASLRSRGSVCGSLADSSWRTLG